MKVMMLMGDSQWDNDIPLEEPVINVINALTEHYQFDPEDTRLIDGSTIQQTSADIIASCTIFGRLQAYSNERMLIEQFWKHYLNGDDIVVVSINTSTKDRIMKDTLHLINRYEIPQYLILLPSSHHEMEGFE